MSRPSPYLAGTSKPPPIPGARSDSTGATARPLLIWVRTGTAHVHIDATAPFHLSAGDGLWIPADGWNHRAIVTEPGTVAFPHLPRGDVGTDGPSAPVRFEVPDGWQDWLIQHFNLQVTPLSGRGYSRDVITDLLRRAGARPAVPPRSRNAEPSALLTPPPMPKSRGARAVAEDLIRDPALDLTVEQWAARAVSSPRTLRRDFLAGTGLSFEQWRLHCRLTAAVEFLAAEYDVDQVAARVGFASRNGFTRAFKQRFGPTPYEFGRRLSASGPVRRDTAARQTDNLVRMVREGATSAAPPDLLPAAATPPHTNGRHVLSWIYRGSGYLDVAGRRYQRHRGLATWIPADVEHITGLRENSISLPLGEAGTSDLLLTEPLQVQFSPAWDDYLMHCSLSARSILRPDDHDPGRILGLFAEQVAAQRALSVPMPVDPQARAVATDYLRRLGLPGRAADRHAPATVRRTFRDETGMTYSSWCYAARMRIARDLLVGGAQPSAVARRLGYAHLPTFSAAFGRFHGLSPRDYQERELGGTTSREGQDG
ncbi:helix-turn-helix domain-containing protein [Microlunatus sp. GCM10028923]|uniref:AraC family transcriptional regulator n=1 Tax=Microlunatus sp. GCM10028923 TaxID=3273400 RepID=UPI00360E3539